MQLRKRYLDLLEFPRNLHNKNSVRIPCFVAVSPNSQAPCVENANSAIDPLNYFLGMKRKKSSVFLINKKNLSSPTSTSVGFTPLLKSDGWWTPRGPFLKRAGSS